MSLSGVTKVFQTSGTESEGNSTSTPLGAGAEFTGTWEKITDYGAISIIVFADQDSATDGLKFEWSADGVNADVVEQSSVPANLGRGFTQMPRGRYFRVRYVNGATPQGAFRLAVDYKQNGISNLSRTLDKPVSGENFAQTVRAVVTGKKPDGSFGNVALDANDRIVTAPPGTSAGVKGFSDGKIVSSGTTSPIAVRATTYAEQTTNGQRSLVSTSANDTAAGTGARKVRITYYDQALAGPFEEVVTLSGLTPVNTAALDICFIEKMDVVEVGSTLSNVGVISLKAAVGGGGATIWSIAATDNQTFGAHHYCPPGVTCNVTGLFVGIKGGDTTGGFLRAVNPLAANASELQISDFLRAPSSGGFFRQYGTAIEVPGPARITAYAHPDSTSSRTYFASFDFYDE